LFIESGLPWCNTRLTHPPPQFLSYSKHWINLKQNKFFLSTTHTFIIHFGIIYYLLMLMSSIVTVLVDSVSSQWTKSSDNHSNFSCESGSSSFYMFCYNGTTSSWSSDETVWVSSKYSKQHLKSRSVAQGGHEG